MGIYIYIYIYIYINWVLVYIYIYIYECDGQYIWVHMLLIKYYPELFAALLSD